MKRGRQALSSGQDELQRHFPYERINQGRAETRLEWRARLWGFWAWREGELTAPFRSGFSVSASRAPVTFRPWRACRAFAPTAALRESSASRATVTTREHRQFPEASGERRQVTASVTATAQVISLPAPSAFSLHPAPLPISFGTPKPKPEAAGLQNGPSP